MSPDTGSYNHQTLDNEEKIIAALPYSMLFQVDDSGKPKLPSAKKVKGGRPAWTYRKAWRNIMRTEGVERPWTDGPITHKLLHPAFRPNARKREMLTINS